MNLTETVDKPALQPSSFLEAIDPLTVRLRAELAAAAPGPARAEALLRLAGILDDEALDYARQALVEAGVDDALRAWSCAVRTEASFYSQDESGALEASYEGQQWAQAAGLPGLEARVLVYRGMLLGGYGDLDRAILLYRQAIGLLGVPADSDRTGRRHLATAWTQLAAILAGAGRTDEAREGYWSAVAAAERVELYQGWPPILNGLLQLLIHQQRWDEARRVVEMSKAAWTTLARFFPANPRRPFAWSTTRLPG